MENTKKEKKEFTPKHFLLIYFITLMLILTFFGIMSWRGYALIKMSVEYLLFGVLVISALIAGLVALLRKFVRRVFKIIVGVLGFAVIFASAVCLLTIFTIMLNLNTPAHYTTLDDPNGGKVVVMREWGESEELIELRAQARWAETGDAEEYTAEDLGYSYFAAPRVFGFFYDTALKSDGYLEIGSTSSAKLMYEWQDSTLRMYIDDAEIGDEGEITLKTH